MRRRNRKLIGAVAMLSFVAIYALVAMLVAQSEVVNRAPGWGQSVFYCVVGLAWILPLMPLIAWMERPDADDPDFGRP